LLLADNFNLIFQYYQVVAENLSDEEIMGLKEMFRSLDTDNSGTITLDELRSGLPKLGTKISESEIRHIMEAVCTRSDIHAIFFVVDYMCPDIYIFFVVTF
jgi:Ca2+-binding EF-hand superfamily protein